MLVASAGGSAVGALLDRLRLAVLRCCSAVAVPAVLAVGGGASVLLSVLLAVVSDFQEKGSKKSIFVKIENKKAKLF